MIVEYMQIEPGQGHTAGRALLKKMYKAHTGTEMPEILIAPQGKPYFAQGDLHFSISHTKHYVFCVLSPSPVGIDAEEATRKVDLRLAEKILSPAEKVQFDAAEDQQAALLIFWVLKEAQAKFTGTGLQGYPNHTDFRLDDPRVQTIGDCLVAIVT